MYWYTLLVKCIPPLPSLLVAPSFPLSLPLCPLSPFLSPASLLGLLPLSNGAEYFTLMGDVQPVSVILLLDSGEWDEASRKCYYMYLSSAMHSVDNWPPTVVLKYWACIPLALVDSYLCIHWLVILFSDLPIHAGMPSPSSAISWYSLLSGFFLKSLTTQQMLQSSHPVTKWFSGYVAYRKLSLDN